MARKKASDYKIEVGNIREVSGEVTIAGGDIYKGFTSEQVSVLLEQITTIFKPKPFDGRCPYKGLDVYEEEDAELFFGREELVEDLISRVRESRVVFITGPSGSGKSSLARAGLIHALKQEAIKELHSNHWLYETIKPGRDSLEALALAFSRLKSPELAYYFRAHSNKADILNECAESVLSGRKDQHLVLFIDQFEEVFSPAIKETERVSFLNLLTQATKIENGRVIILFAMRSDFVSNCAMYPDLNTLLNQQFVQVGAMRPNELVSAIAQPALRVGLRIDPDLVAHIINDMKGEPGALPLMQFALKDLFDFQQELGGVIALTLIDYLKRGGIDEALQRHADDSLANFRESEQELARSIFSRLIEIGQSTQETRRTALFDELVPATASKEDVQAVVQKLADARLITTDEQAGKDTVTISHEKLIDAWPWLKKLVNENRDVITLQNEIANDAKEWEDHNRDESYLYIGARLANAREQLEARKLALSALAQSFIESGVKAHADELEAANQRTVQLQKRSLYLTGALIVALIAMGVAIFFGVQSQKQANIAFGRQLAFQAQSINSLSETSDQMIAVLLAVRSMQIFPTADAAQVLQNNLLALPLMRVSWTGSLSFSPDGEYWIYKRHFTGGDTEYKDDSINILKAATGKEILNMNISSSDNIYNVDFSSDSKYVASASCDSITIVVEAVGGCAQGSARVWEASTGKEVSRINYDTFVRTIDFSPDGKYVISGSDDHTARVWEATTGQEISRMSHEGAVYSVAFSSDGKYVVSGSSDGIAIVWDAKSGEEVAQNASNGIVISVAFSPNGKYVIVNYVEYISPRYEYRVKVWESATGNEIARWPEGFIEEVAFSSDGNYIATDGCEKGNARFNCSQWKTSVWNVMTGSEISNKYSSGSANQFFGGEVNFIAFSPSGKYIVTEGDNGNTILIWETLTGNEISRIASDEFQTFEMSPDGRFIAVTACDETNTDALSCVKESIHVLETTTGKEVARMPHGENISDVVFSPDSKYILSGSYDGIARFWEAATGKEIAHMTHERGGVYVYFSPNRKYVISMGVDGTRTWEPKSVKETPNMIHESAVTSVAFSPDGIYVISGSDDNTARLWDATNGQEISRMTHDAAVTSVAISPDGKYVISGSDDHTVRLWDVARGQEISRMTHDAAITSVAFSPDGKYVASGSRDNTTRVWVATTGKEVARMTHDGEVISVAFSPNGKYIFSSGEDGKVRMWDTMSGKEITKIDEYGIKSMAISPDGRYLALGYCFQSENGSGYTDICSASVFKTTTGKEIASIDEVKDVSAISVVFSPNGAYIASGMSDGTALVWRAVTGKEVAHLTHSSKITAITFSPDEKYLISGDQNGIASVWEAATGKEIARMTHDGAITSVAFSPDGKYVVSGSADNIARLWKWQPEGLIADACSRVTRNLTRVEWIRYFGDLTYQAICPNLPVEPEPRPEYSENRSLTPSDIGSAFICCVLPVSIGLGLFVWFKKRRKELVRVT